MPDMDNFYDAYSNAVELAGSVYAEVSFEYDEMKYIVRPMHLGRKVRMLEQEIEELKRAKG